MTSGLHSGATWRAQEWPSLPIQLGTPVHWQSLTGGIISRTWRVTFAEGGTAVVKTCAAAPHDLYRIEAEALEALRLPTGLAVPRVLHVAHDQLVLEDFGPQPAWDEWPAAPDDHAYWEGYGRGLAHLHARRVPRFGWHRDTYWGLLRFNNAWTNDGHAFHADTRFRVFLTRPRLNTKLEPDDRRRLALVAERLPEFMPISPACLLHGDLWAGNRARTPTGQPALIDPFVHYGWAEFELHGTLMYGGFPPRFFDAYLESNPLEPGWRKRLGVFEILHLCGILDQIDDEPESLTWLRRLLLRFVG